MKKYILSALLLLFMTTIAMATMPGSANGPIKLTDGPITMFSDLSDDVTEGIVQDDGNVIHWEYVVDDIAAFKWSSQYVPQIFPDWAPGYVSGERATYFYEDGTYVTVDLTQPGPNGAPMVVDVGTYHR